MEHSPDSMQKEKDKEEKNKQHERGGGGEKEGEIIQKGKVKVGSKKNRKRSMRNTVLSAERVG